MSVLAAAIVAVVLAVAGGLADPTASPVDGAVIVLLVYLVVYLTVTSVVFSRAGSGDIRRWAARESRGTFVQRYVTGSAPGPGVSIFFAAVALGVAMLWLPSRGGESLPSPVRLAIGGLLVVVAWVCVVVSFAVAFFADNIVEDDAALEFPGGRAARWSDYVYFAVSVMTTFGTTDVTVTSRRMRRTITAHAIIAFVFNTVTVATLVTALNNG